MKSRTTSHPSRARSSTGSWIRSEFMADPEWDRTFSAGFSWLTELGWSLKQGAGYRMESCRFVWLQTITTESVSLQDDPHDPIGAKSRGDFRSHWRRFVLALVDAGRFADPTATGTHLHNVNSPSKPENHHQDRRNALSHNNVPGLRRLARLGRQRSVWHDDCWKPDFFPM